MVTANMFGRIKICISVNFWMAKNMDQVFGNSILLLTNMKVNTNKIKELEKVNIDGKMGIYIVDSLKTT